MPKKELAIFLRDYVDVGLMILKNVPEYYEGTSPNKFFDYLSVGIPILINYPGWLSDLITKNKLGYAINPGEISDFANYLINLSENNKQIEEFGRNSRYIAEKNFSSYDIAKKFREILERVYINNEKNK